MAVTGIESTSDDNKPDNYGTTDIFKSIIKRVDKLIQCCYVIKSDLPI